MVKNITGKGITEKKYYLFAALRIALGWIFFWAFLDKLLGLGFSTAPDKSWIQGGSPTAGFLQFGTSGPLGPLFQSLADSVVVEWLFMLGLLLIGLALLLGIGMKIASYSGIVLMILMWLALLPPKNNPLIDEHIIYALALWGLRVVKSGQVWGLGAWWSRTPLVRKYPFLE